MKIGCKRQISVQTYTRRSIIIAIGDRGCISKIMVIFRNCARLIHWRGPNETRQCTETINIQIKIQIQFEMKLKNNAPSQTWKRYKLRPATTTNHHVGGCFQQRRCIKIQIEDTNKSAVLNWWWVQTLIHEILHQKPKLKTKAQEP